MALDVGTIIRKETLGQGIGNIVANGLIAWSLLKDREALDLWAFDGIAFDVALTCLLLSLIVAWIVMGTQRSRLKKGKVAAVEPDANNKWHRFLLKAPRATGWAAVCFGLVGLFIVAPVTLLAFQLLGIHSTAPMNYIVFKALWTGVMAASIVTPAVYIALLRRS